VTPADQLEGVRLPNVRSYKMGFWDLRREGKLPYQSNLLLCGFTAGLVLGALSSEIMVVLSSIFLHSDGISDMLFILLEGQFIAVVPAVFIGMLFGVLISLAFRINGPDLTVRAGAILGLVAASVLAVIILFPVAQWLSSAVPLSGWPKDAYWLTFPTLVVYLVSGALCGVELAICKTVIHGRRGA